MLVINGVTAIWKASVKIMDNNTAHTHKKNQLRPLKELSG